LNPDFNGASPEGVGLYQNTARNGFRMSAARAYLHPAAKRPNLRIVKRAHATRILFEGGRAVGVEYSRKGAIVSGLCRPGSHSVSAGSVNSPQLLHALRRRRGRQPETPGDRHGA
jgi:choline dehydrogenase